MSRDLITRQDVENQFIRVQRAAIRLGLPQSQNWVLHSSPTHGVSWSAMVRDENGGESGIIGTDNGLLGFSRREAHMRLSAIARTLEDVAEFQVQRKVEAERERAAINTETERRPVFRIVSTSGDHVTMGSRA